jgi:hypothetical protein
MHLGVISSVSETIPSHRQTSHKKKFQCNDGPGPVTIQRKNVVSRFWTNSRKQILTLFVVTTWLGPIRHTYQETNHETRHVLI